MTGSGVPFSFVRYALSEEYLLVQYGKSMQGTLTAEGKVRAAALIVQSGGNFHFFRHCDSQALIGTKVMVFKEERCDRHNI
mmetsp:Transcript_13613/g.38304  ORF Transcript_13613/g.38304 Transcript_13613/m.38304 type:complete len:81 (-) Transcript_13613:478-720(-)